MPKYIAITVAGAVSLGCYEAGVLYEILEAIAQHNEDSQTQAKKDYIFIDVITGASAGGMSSTILAQNLLWNGQSFRNPATNPLYLPWVTTISLDGLLTSLPGDNQVMGVRSILSSALIDEISKKFISTSDLGPKELHPAIDPNRRQFALGLALSNLDGIDYARSVMTGGDFVYTRYQDEVVRVLDGSAGESTGAYWEIIRQTAVACGAFPFAFAVRQLARAPSDFIYPWSDPPFRFPDTDGKYAYTDGGVFQNEPLGLAKNLVNEIGTENQFNERFYLFIAPGAKDSTIAEKDAESKDPGPLTADQANFWNTAKALLSAIFQQARFHDWVQAEEVNDKVQMFNERAAELMAALLRGSVTPAQLDPASGTLNPLLAAQKDVSLESIRAELTSQFSKEFAKLQAASPDMASAWIDAILTLELAADLEDKDEMNIIGITATNEELACDPLFSFGGFFSQAYRQHDYDLGRNKAKLFLRTQLNPGPGPNLGPIRYNPGLDIPLDQQISAIAALDTDDAAVAQLDQSERIHLKSQIQKCIDAMLTQASVPWFVKQGAEWFYIPQKLNEWLKL